MEASTYPEWAAIDLYALDFHMSAPAVGESIVRGTALLLNVK